MEKPMSVGPDPKIGRKIYGLLDSHFDDLNRTYRRGWDDTRIATEADTSVDLVTRIRREAYGELAEDPRIQVLKDDLELLRMEVTEAQNASTEKLTALFNKIGELEARCTNIKLKKVV